jgi:hypothetical protein
VSFVKIYEGEPIFAIISNTREDVQYTVVSNKCMCRARVHFFHQLSILERAADHKCIIIAACQKKRQVWEVFQIQQSPIF